MSNTFDKLSVLDSFIEEVDSYLPEIEANLERLAHSPGDMDALEETYRRTHTIGGSASMMDFPGLAHVAHGMEDILADTLDGVTTLDEPTINLLQRSLSRIHRLLRGIREGVDEEAIVAEDDEDFARYQEQINASAYTAQSSSEGYEEYEEVEDDVQVQNAPSPAAMHSYEAAPLLSSLEQPAPLAAMPSFDEVLASFRTPPIASIEDVVWPEEDVVFAPSVSTSSTTLPVSQTQAEQVIDTEPAPMEAALQEMASGAEGIQAPGSALDKLVASTRQIPTFPQATASITPNPPVLPEQHVHVDSGYSVQLTNPPGASSTEITQSVQAVQASQSIPSHLQNIEPETNDARPSQAYDDMQRDAHALEQVTSLRTLVTQLRSAVSFIENQRGEFKGFLDGSKDALDRMEDWAGQAMGLNLRNSPEQVRRYLPLSVMWVANSKLKKVLDLLNGIASGIETTDEHIQAALQQLYLSLESCGAAFEQLQTEASSAHILMQEPGWTPWEMQTTRNADTVRERVTFERRGDIAALRAEVEQQLYEEMRQEFESRSISLAARAELEQQIRNELRQEFEAKRQLQEHYSGASGSESLRELEARLRSEIEIQVRQEFLNQISSNEQLASALQSPTPTSRTPSPANFVDWASADVQSREIAGGSLPAQQRQALPGSLPFSSSGSQPKPPSTQPLRSTVSDTSTELGATNEQIKPASTAAPVTKPPSSTSSPSPSFSDFGEEATEIFRLEAEEHLQTISMHVAALERAPTNRELIQGIRRATHTLKGAAGMMGFRAIADLCHVSEDLLDSIMEGSTAISPEVLSLILDTAETLDVLITGRDANQISDATRVEALRSRYVELLGEQSAALPAIEEDIDVDIESNNEPAPQPTLVAGLIGDESQGETAGQRTSHGDLSVRVRLQKLDDLVGLFGELLVNRSVLEDRLGRLSRLVADVSISSNRLRDVGQKLESRFEAATLPSGHSVQVMPGEGDQANGFVFNGNKNGKNGGEPAHLAEFDELELDRYTEFHQLARGLSEGISDMATLSTEMDAIIRECENVFARENRLSTTFQDRLMKVRLVPLATMTPRLYRAARAVALKQRKEFEFLLDGEETEVDRTVYEEIAGPLLHLMRNAVNHAIETPDVRIQKGKPPAGKITLSAAYEGNMVVITVRDDGTGIDPEHVRNSAIARGLIHPDQVLSEGDVIDLIFRPGFSTAEVLSEESGRGVGLDVVRDSVARLRGTLVVDSTPGKGTAFTMKFPTSLAIQSVMMVRVGGQQYAVPTVMVESIGRLDTFKRSTLSGQPAVIVQNDFYPLITLSQYLALPVGLIEDRSPLLLVNAAGRRVALVVDEVKSKSDVVMKNLGPHLRHVHGIAGGTVLGNGHVILILELNELLSNRSRFPVNTASGAAAAGAAARSDAGRISSSPQMPQGSQIKQSRDVPAVSKQPSSIKTSAPASSVERGKHVLVVDDSPSVRRVVSNMLKQHGWEVQMARDGVEAFEMISRDTPAAVLLDIEMPRMDGYELIATVRSQEQYRALPLVVLTSRAATKHQQRALQLGASAYVVKPYQDEELINTLNSLVYDAAVR